MTPNEWDARDAEVYARDDDHPTYDMRVLLAGAATPDSERSAINRRDKIRNAHGIAEEHNAIPVLVEIAAAALALRDAHDELDAIERNMLHVGAASFDQLVGGRSTHDAKVKVNERGAALLAALAKVLP